MELERYRTTLAAQAAGLSQTLRNRKLIAIESAAEDCQQMVQPAQREVAVETVDRHSRRLREVKVALARIEDGRYGIGETCADAVKPRCLDAVP